eukprot:7126129-Pyramimonas_sp.AAC.1
MHMNMLPHICVMPAHICVIPHTAQLLEGAFRLDWMIFAVGFVAFRPTYGSVLANLHSNCFDFVKFHPESFFQWPPRYSDGVVICLACPKLLSGIHTMCLARATLCELPALKP